MNEEEDTLSLGPLTPRQYSRAAVGTQESAGGTSRARVKAEHQEELDA